VPGHPVWQVCTVETLPETKQAQENDIYADQMKDLASGDPQRPDTVFWRSGESITYCTAGS
jgi:hypothetical protein